MQWLRSCFMCVPWLAIGCSGNGDDGSADGSTTGDTSGDTAADTTDGPGEDTLPDAAVGGVTGALVGAGIPEYEAKRYEGMLKSGHILVSVHTENGDEVKRAKEIFEQLGAKDVGTVAEAKVPSAEDPARP